MKEGNILVVDDNKAILTALDLLLPMHFKKVTTLSSTSSLIRIIADQQIDVVLLDMNFKAGINSGNEGLFWLGEVKSQFPCCEVVLFTAYADVDLAVEAVKRGAFDFVTKPFDNAKIVSTIKAALRMSLSGKEIRSLKEVNKELVSSGMNGDFFRGESRQMRELLEMVAKVAPTDASILITGENGTGKDVFAAEIHRRSSRSNEVFIKADIASLTESLFESELFGHVKGSFTDAKSDRTGKFEAANGGTLFLDEIGNIPLHLQAKLLNVLQNRIVYKVGSNIPVPVNIRLICASNRDLASMAIQGGFREDLLYRINTIHMELPPLRQRKCDIVPLAYLFLERYSLRYGKTIKGISNIACEKLRNYHWRGNIRELQHSVEKAVILAERDFLDEGDFLFTSDSFSSHHSTLESRNKACLPHSGLTLEQMEREMIRSSMESNGRNMSLVASQLGISRQTLYNKMRKYDL